ncbi:MAG: chemotaxis protein CheD [Sandaracinaceae bacterium]
MLHVMLPTSRIDPERAKASPMMYVDTGLPRLFRKAYMLGAKKQNIEVTVAGGASSLPGMSGRLRIGARNFSAVRRCLFQNGVLIRAHDVGGTAPRTMVMRVDTGAVLIRSNGREYSL